jgi:hypothetical protein
MKMLAVGIPLTTPRYDNELLSYLYRRFDSHVTRAHIILWYERDFISR